MNRLILFPNDTATFYSRVPTTGFMKFLFRSSHPVNVLICNAAETDIKTASKKYTFNNHLCINNTLSIPTEWKNIAVHIKNPSDKEKIMCEYEFKFSSKRSNHGS